MALVRIQIRRDTADNWTTTNPVLAEGEMGVELDTGRIKVGDGVRNWQNIPYTSGPVPADVAPLDVGQRNAGVSLQYARADHSHAFPASANFTQITAGSATITGNLSVTGNLIGGSHTHTVAQITNWATAVSDAVFSNLVAGANVTLVRDPQTGKTTIAATGGGAGAVSSVAGRTGDVTLTTLDLGNWPSPAGQSGKYLTTDGSLYLWADPYEDGGVATVNDLTGNVTVKAGTNVTMLTNPSTNEITISAATSAGTGDVTSVNALVGALTIAAAEGSGLSVAASGSTITLDVTISYDDLTDVPADFPPASHTHTTADITDFQEAVEDAVDGLLVAGTNVTLTYDDGAGTLTIAAAGASAPTLIAGNAIAIDTDTPGEAEISVDGTLDGGSYEGFAIPPDPPFFSEQPQSQLVTFGTATFSARVENAPSPTYLWQKAEAGTDTWLGLTNNSPFSGVTTNTLTISPVSDSDNGDQFRLQVTLPDGSVLLSSVATLYTNGLRITRQPQSATLTEAATLDVDVYLAVDAEGGVLPYGFQWEKWDGSQWALAVGETESSVSQISGTLGSNEEQRVERWRARVTDGNSVRVYSDTAFIAINAEPPVIVSEPSDASVASGSATLVCEYSGKGAAASWERRLPGDSSFGGIGQTGSITSLPGGVSRSTLNLSGLTGNDNGSQYRLRAANVGGAAFSRGALLTTGGPVISSQPSSVTAVEGTQAQMTVVASVASGALTYQWQRRAPGGSWAEVSGATSATITLSAAYVTLAKDGESYRVVVTGGGVSTTSDAALLTVIAAQDAGDALFTTDPQNATVAEGGRYAVDAVSTWLPTTAHYASIRVEFDDGLVEYHPLSTGVSWLGTVTRRHAAGAHQRYSGSVLITKDAWVSVVASTFAPTALSVDGTAYTVQPWANIRTNTANCTVTTPEERPITGILSYSTTPTVSPSCSAQITISRPEPPYSYLESKRARVSVRRVQSSIRPTAVSGPTSQTASYLFEGASSTDGQVVVAVPVPRAAYYLRSTDGGDTWRMRPLPLAGATSKVVYAWGKFYIQAGEYDPALGVVNRPPYVMESADEGQTFTVKDWSFGREAFRLSFAGDRLFAVSPVINGFTASYIISSKTETGDWVSVPSGFSYDYRTTPVADPLKPPRWLMYSVTYAHGQYFFADRVSSDGVSWAAMQSAPPLFSSAGPKTNPKPVTYRQVDADNTANSYVLASTGFSAPAPGGVATTTFSRISNGQSGAGVQVGNQIYFSFQELPYTFPPPPDTEFGAAFLAKSIGSPAANRRLYGHRTFRRAIQDQNGTGFWSNAQQGEWSDVFVMTHRFGGDYGDDLPGGFLGENDPNLEGAIMLPDRLLHLFAYRNPNFDGVDPGRPPVDQG